MADSPSLRPDGPLRVTLSCDGEAQASLPLYSVVVRHALNAVSWARITIQDGHMPTGSTELSDSAMFKPGATLQIQAGYGDEQALIFSGIVVRHGFRIDGRNLSRLELECRHESTRMTLGRRNAHYIDQTDSAIIEKLIQRHGLGADVASTAIAHKTLAQHGCSDWDFMLARAELMGLVLRCEDGKLSLQAPDLAAEPVLQLHWGLDLIDFSADIDARSQWSEAQACSWDLQSQGLLQGSAQEPADDAGQGNLDGSALAEVASPATLLLHSGAPQTKDVLDAWAKATQLKAALSRMQGQMRFQGHAAAKPGCVVDLQKVGERFSGPCYLTAVQHELRDGEWITEARFGLPPDWQTQRADVHAPANGGLLPAVQGLHVGKVIKLDEDPDSQQRIQIALPALDAESPHIWARLAQPLASSGFGCFFLPEVGDEVIVGFFHDDPSHPVVLGCLYSSARVPPYELDAKNPVKAVVSRYKHRLVFDEENKSITIETAQKNTLILDDDGKRCVLKDQNGNSITLDGSGIRLESAKAIVLDARTDIQGTAKANIQLEASSNFSASGLNVDCEAKVALTAKGSAKAELSASGQTTVRGAMVMIN